MSHRFCKGFSLIILSALAILANSFRADAQTITAGGTVVDSSTGEALPGVVVVVKGTSEHAISDLDGNFSLTVRGGAVLEFSLMGYKTLEKKASASMGRIPLDSDVQLLEEVQVIAYGKQS